MDYGKYKYERDIRQKEARKKQSRIEVKEIKFRPKIDPHDYATKKGHVVRFLNAGARVKVTIMFRGREMAHTELGRKILDRLVGDLKDLATVDSYPKLDGRNMVMVIAPVKKQVQHEPHQRSRRDADLPAAAPAAVTATNGDAPAEAEGAEPAAVEPDEAAVPAPGSEPAGPSEETPEPDALEPEAAAAPADDPVDVPAGALPPEPPAAATGS
jgi:translation initiation factor IF-3